MYALIEAARAIPPIASAILALLLLWFMWRWALLSAQSRALAVQDAAINAYEKRIKQLEDAREEDRQERQSLRDEIAELRGEVKGQRDLAKAIVEVVGESRICLSAPDCTERVLPSI
jgi:septal ring factor EnvC (AmiA/AmiB activator)